MLSMSSLLVVLEESSDMAQFVFKGIIVRSILVQEPVIVMTILEKVFWSTALRKVGISLFASPLNQVAS